MAKKRKAASRASNGPSDRKPRQPYEVDETFDDSADEFRAGADRILLDDNPVTKRLKRIEEQERELDGSDEEVYHEDATSSSEDDGERAPEDEGEEEVENWGSSKDAYFDADVIETEADALAEEEEAKRLMLKQMKGMSEKDYGFDDLEWKDEKSRTVMVEKLPDVQISEDTPVGDRLKILKTRYPEFDPLVRDFVDLQQKYNELSASNAKSISAHGKPVNSVAPLQLRALSTYLATIAVYLAVLTQTTNGLALPPSQLRDHDVMSKLFQARQLWEDCKDLRPVESNSPTNVVMMETPSNVDVAPAKPMKQKQDGKSRKKQEKSKKTTEPIEVEDSLPVKDKKMKKINRAGLEDIFSSALEKTADDSESEFGDENPLTGQEAAEKARKKKSLRFYTSQISQKANKRGAASREAGGDDDVPHKERLRDRQERLLREAQHRATNKTSNAELTNNDSDEDVRDIPAEDDYYDMLSSRSKEKKAAKEARAEAESRGQEYLEDEVGDDGKRKISYAIQKNKGLAPKRKKEVRNPRVKKRNMYDKKMKKLAVVRPQYKGGEGRGGYKGELTGIKTNVIKSIKL